MPAAPHAPHHPQVPGCRPPLTPLSAHRYPDAGRPSRPSAPTGTRMPAAPHAPQRPQGSAALQETAGFNFMDKLFEMQRTDDSQRREQHFSNAGNSRASCSLWLPVALTSRPQRPPPMASSSRPQASAMSLVSEKRERGCVKGCAKITQQHGGHVCGYEELPRQLRAFYSRLFFNYAQILFLSNLWSTN
ncbi:uncharacterized protein [Symphalangus syndactylus]|uniref:uncharacterized protein n=1 Tax=Symphalangus syndactylus TaxID=9590 RepID=UPI0030058C39